MTSNMVITEISVLNFPFPLKITMKIKAKQFAKSFTDAPLKRLNRKAAANLLRVSEHSDSLGGHSGSAVQHWKKPHVISAVNIHNNRVGRKVLHHSTIICTNYTCNRTSFLNNYLESNRWPNKVYRRNANATAFLVKNEFLINYMIF